MEAAGDEPYLRIISIITCHIATVFTWSVVTPSIIDYDAISHRAVGSRHITRLITNKTNQLSCSGRPSAFCTYHSNGYHSIFNMVQHYPCGNIT